MPRLRENTPTTAHPYPKYLIDRVSRQLIADLEDRGVRIVLSAAASRSVTVIAQTKDGHTLEEIGRAECLPDLLGQIAARCGIDLDTF